MNKIFIVAALMFASANIASAEMTMTPSQHPVYGDPAKGMETTIIGYISNVEWDKNMAEAAARSGQKLPVAELDKPVVDEMGVVYTNPCSSAFVSRYTCLNLTKTAKYRNDMIAMASQVKAFGIASQFPQLAGWFSLVK